MLTSSSTTRILSECSAAIWIRRTPFARNTLRKGTEETLENQLFTHQRAGVPRPPPALYGHRHFQSERQDLSELPVCQKKILRLYFRHSRIRGLFDVGISR